MLLSVLALALAPRTADAASSANECASSYENAQIFRRKARLQEARVAMAACSQSTCPGIVRKDCSLWLSQIEDDIPTVVVVPRAPDGTDLSDVRLRIDGQPLESAARGQAIEINPGEHTFRFEREGAKPVEQRVVIHQGQKNRLILVTIPATLRSEPEAPAPPNQAHDDTRSQPVAEPSVSSSRQAAYLVAAGSALALGTSAYLGITGRSDLDALRKNCAPACLDAEIAPVKSRLIVSDIALGAGLVSLAVAAYLFFSDSPRKPKNQALSVDLRANGLAQEVSLEARFP